MENRPILHIFRGFKIARFMPGIAGECKIARIMGWLILFVEKVPDLQAATGSCIFCGGLEMARFSPVGWGKKIAGGEMKNHPIYVQQPVG
jgi:hypothetical protein